MNPVPTHGMAWGPVILIILLLTLIPGTILGWVAAKRILESEGRLYGLRLAAFAGLFFPTILLILIPIGSFAIVLRIGTFSAGMLEEDAMIIGAAVFGTLALLSIKIFQGLFRRILGKGRFRDSFGLRKNRWLIGAIVTIWLTLGSALFLQRPKQLDEPTAANSPDGTYRAEASTWHRMRIFDKDQLSYRFSLQDEEGSVMRSWEIPVPTTRLAKDLQAQPVERFQFSGKGTIHWQSDNSEVVFLVDGTEVFRIEPDKIGTGSESSYGASVTRVQTSKDLTSRTSGANNSGGTRFTTEHEMTIPYPRSGSRTAFLDLDTREFLEGAAIHSLTQNRFGSTGSKPKNADRKIEEWASRHEADLMTLQIKPEIQVAFYGGPMTQQPFLDYATATATQVLEAAAKLPQGPPSGTGPPQVTLIGPDPEIPFVFRTREGGIGLLELRKSPEIPKGGLIVRYKTIRRGP